MNHNKKRFLIPQVVKVKWEEGCWEGWFDNVWQRRAENKGQNLKNRCTLIWIAKNKCVTLNICSMPYSPPVAHRYGHKIVPNPIQFSRRLYFSISPFLSHSLSLTLSLPLTHSVFSLSLTCSYSLIYAIWYKMIKTDWQKKKLLEINLRRKFEAVVAGHSSSWHFRMSLNHPLTIYSTVSPKPLY